MENFLPLIVFWGVWLLVPMMIDGMTTLVSLMVVLFIHKFHQPGTSRQLNYYPHISVVIPVYNSAKTLETCLRSLSDQDYPKDRMEILLIDNGSTDESFKIFNRIQPELGLQIRWHSIINQGKAWALNAGIYLSRGAYIFNIDSDVVLARDAIRQVVEAMESEQDLGAVTGVVDVLPAPEDAPLYLRVLADCEFFEYLTAFHVGRVQQTILQNLYTLSGAFSVFRREVLLETFLYNQETVTEDTDLTFFIYERLHGWRLACVRTAICYVTPVESLGALYAQRVRWQRGQIEVSSRYKGLLDKPIWRIRGFSPARILLIDHTLAFPRIVWTFLLPILTLFGYPLSLIFMSFFFLYCFYLAIDLVWIGVAWLGINGHARNRLKRTIWLAPIMPLYRMFIFWFRFAGYLYAIAEPGVWRVQDPIALLNQAWSEIFSYMEQAVHWVFNLRGTLFEKWGIKRR